MLADDFLGRVTLDALSADVPVGDNAVRIEHVKRVIGNATYQQTKMFFTLPQSLDGLAPFGDVAGNLGKANELAVFVDGIDHDGSEKFRAILALTPALGLEFSTLARRLERNSGQSRFAIFRQVKHSEMPAYHVGCVIALDPFGAGIPVGDDAVGVQHVDGVVDNPFHQQAKSALAFEQAAPGCVFWSHTTLPNPT
jgi:hypothetical protein